MESLIHRKLGFWRKANCKSHAGQSKNPTPFAIVEYTILKSNLGRASDNLCKVISVDSPLKIALTHAVFLYKDSIYAISQARQALISDKRSTPAVHQSVQNDALLFAKQVVSWDTAATENGSAHASRRKQYEEYIALLTTQFDLFHKPYQKLAPSLPIPPFPFSKVIHDCRLFVYAPHSASTLVRLQTILQVNPRSNPPRWHRPLHERAPRIPQPPHHYPRHHKTNSLPRHRLQSPPTPTPTRPCHLPQRYICWWWYIYPSAAEDGHAFGTSQV